MKNKKVRALICSLAAVMAIGFVPTCLTGCGKSSDNTEVSSTSNKKETAKKSDKKADKKANSKSTAETQAALVEAFKSVATENGLDDLSTNDSFSGVGDSMKATGAKDYAVYGKLASGLSCQLIVADESISKLFLDQFKTQYNLTEVEKNDKSTILSGEITSCKGFVAGGKCYTLICMGLNEEEVKDITTKINTKLADI